MGGKFVISLDFELMWGVRDKRSIESYGDAIIGARKAVEQMLIRFDLFKIKVTFATVGFLFFENKWELIGSVPKLKPSYSNDNLSNYIGLGEFLGDNEVIDPYHFGISLIHLIKNYGCHEIGTHTFSHYYCLEDGQNLEQFNEDLKCALEIANKHHLILNSIVFPRNQYNKDYIKVCARNGLTAFRGTEKSWIYSSSSAAKDSIFKRGCRLLDTYVNITGYNCYKFNQNNISTPLNIPSSRFLRPYNDTLHLFEWLKMRRIKRAMTYAAKNKLVYHLWWHPHNFGRNLEKNLNMLEDILKHYCFLRDVYDFQSLTMGELTREVLGK
jgi:hypothetical protein